MDMNDPSNFTHKHFLMALIKDLKAVFPQTRYLPKHDIQTIMQKEGNQQVIDYITKKYMR